MVFLCPLSGIGVSNFYPVRQELELQKVMQEYKIVFNSFSHFCTMRYKESAKLTIISNGLNHKIGSLSADFVRFMMWGNKNQALRSGMPAALEPHILLEILRFLSCLRSKLLTTNRAYRRYK